MTHDRPRVTIAILLLAADGRIPDRLYRVLCRAYHACHETGLRVRAARPARFRLMVADGPYSEPVEWVRYDGRYKMPIPTFPEAVRRLVEAERRHPESCWWIEPGPGRRWHRPALFDDDFRAIL